MKRIFLLNCLLLMGLYSSMQAQKIVVSYLKESPLLPIPPKLLEQVGGNKFDKSKFLSKSTLSIYPTFSEYHTDSIFYLIETSYPFKHSLIPEYVYKIYSEQLIYSHDVQLDEENEAFINQVDESLVWEINWNKKRKILGLNCVHARARVDNEYSSGYIEVWFAEDIPFPDGPVYSYCFKFPGLILELSNPMVGTYYTVESIELKEPDQGEMMPPEFTVVKKDSDYRSNHYLGLGRDSKYILSEQSPQNVWLPYPKE